MVKDRLKRLLTWLRSPGENLSQRVLHGGIWVTFLNFSERGIQILYWIILARLLAPSDFGLMGIALLAIGATEQLANLGIDSALIQREDDDIDSYLNTAWTMKITRGIGLFLLFLLVAPAAATFFDEARATPVLRVLGIGLLLSGFVNPSIVYFRKDLEFQKQFVYRMSGTVADFVVAVGAALIFQSVWALVAGALSKRFVKMVSSYLLSGYRPRIEFDRDYATEILDYGKWIWASTLVVFLALSGDDAFVGWYLTAASLGFYQMAFRLSNAPATEITHVISRVMFPAYSKLQNDQEALQSAFLKTIRVTFLIVIPMSAGIVLVAPEFTRIVLGEKWVPIIPVIQVMGVAGLFRAITATGGVLFQGYGVPEWDFRMNALRVGAIALTIWPLTDMWGITGAAVSITIGLGLTFFPWAYKTADITGLSIAEYGRTVLIPVAGTAVMVGAVVVVLGPSIWRLGGAIFVGALVYFGSTFLLYQYQSDNPINDVIALAK